MSEIGKKLSFPQTSQIPDEATRVYARKLTRVLDEMRDWLLQALQSQVTEITNNLGVSDHGELTGLEDIEDHLYAFLHDGSRPFTAYGPGFTNDTALSDNDPFKAVSEYAIKAYVDALLAYILASPVGSIIYIWEDADGDKYLQRLIPGQYGQVLVTGGAGERPFWDWVWWSPGAEGAPSIYRYVIIYSSYAVALLTISRSANEQAAIGSSVVCDQGGPSDDWQYNWQYPEIAAVDAVAVISPDQSIAEALPTSDLTVEIVTSHTLFEVNVYDGLVVTEHVEPVVD